MTTFPVDDRGIISRAAAISAGHTDEQLAAAARSGHLRRLRAGIWVARAGLDHEEAHRLRILTSTGPQVVVSHQSAAILHGIEMLKADLRRVHVTNGSVAGGRVTATRHIHAGLIDQSDVVNVDGVWVTSPERTAVDVACGGDFDRALVVFDSALRVGADRESITDMLRGRRRQGIGVARRAFPYADGDSASVGESWSRAQMIAAGIMLPRLQDDRVIRGRRIITDFDWDRKLVGEFDGRVKYGRLVPDGQTTADVVLDEKDREDILRWSGSMVVRWIWGNLERREVVGLVTPWLYRLGLT